MLRAFLKPTVYLADQANIYSDIDVVKDGITVIIKGFNDSLSIFAIDLIKKVFEFSERKDEESFKNTFDKVKKVYSNYPKNSPIQICNEFFSVLTLSQGNFSFETKLEKINNINFKEFINECNFKNWLKRIRFKWLFNGNFSLENVQNISKEVENIFSENNIVIKKKKISYSYININYYLFLNLKVS